MVFVVLTVLIVLQIVSKDRHVDFVKAAKWVDRSAVSLRSLKEVLSSWIQPLVRILSWPASSPATRRWIAQLTIGPFRVLLFHVSVQSWVREVSFLAVFAFEISALIVILGSSLADLARRVLVLVFIIGVIGAINIILTLVLIVVVVHLIFC